MKNVYEDKKLFVRDLSRAYSKHLRDVDAIKYHKIPDLEVVEIKYFNGARSYINVTINSNKAIAKEIIAELSGTGAVGYISGEESIKRIKDLISKEEDTEYESTLYFAKEDITITLNTILKLLKAEAFENTFKKDLMLDMCREYSIVPVFNATGHIAAFKLAAEL